jgi:hypothetical protein
MQLTLSGSQIFLADGPVDFRRSIDGLSAIVFEVLDGKPISDSITSVRSF